MLDRAMLRRLVARHPIGAVGAGLIAILVAVALLAPLLAPYQPAAQIAPRLQAPSQVHLLGTDEFGRDVLARIIYGARISIFVGLVSVGIAFMSGVTVGLLAGYFGGRLDHAAMRVMDIIFSFPALILAITITGILGPNLTNATIAIGIVYMPTFARLTRGTVLSVIQHEFVTAARALGASDSRVMLTHVLPNVTAPLIVQTTLNLSTAILAEAALSFLGLGTQPPDPSWGTMLGTGRRYMASAPWVAVFPGLAIMLAVLAFNLLGDGLRDFLDPRLR